MALQKATNAGNATGFKFEKRGDVIDGYYLGTTDEVINGSPCKKHLFKTANGLFSVLGQADMYKQLSGNNCLNLRVVVEFTGNVQKLKGGKTMKLYDVSFDPEDTYNGAAPEQDNGEEPDYDDVEETDVDAEEQPVDEVKVQRAAPPRQPLSAPNADRARAVQQLLNKSRAKTA